MVKTVTNSMLEFVTHYAYSKFQGVGISVTVKAGAVNVLITLNHPAAVLFLLSRITEIDSVVSIDSAVIV